MRDFLSFDSVNNVYYQPNHDKPVTVVGNTSELIDWPIILNKLRTLNGNELPEFNKVNIHYQKMLELFNSSKTNRSNMQWINFYPNVHYDQHIDNKICNFLGHTNWARAWISEVRPGKIVPWHYDFDDNEKQFLSTGKLVRYSIKLTDQIGHVAIVGNNVLSGEIGDVFKWNDHRDWHGSLNCSSVSKFQYNFLAYQ
jgi:hypothetical protein